MKEYMTGIGGIFFRTKDKEKTRNWYRDHFGLESESWGAVFLWKDHKNPEKEGNTAWAPFENESDYFGNRDQQFMINYRVANIEELLPKLENAGIKIVKQLESNDFGKFAWIEDIDNRRVELWEPGEGS